MGEYKKNMLNVSSGYYSEIEQFTLKNKLQPLIQIDRDVTGIQLIVDEPKLQIS
jgi:hypothetical protein